MPLNDFSPKQPVLEGFLELSESRIHFSIAFGRFLSFSVEIAADYERTTTGLSTELFSPQMPDPRLLKKPSRGIIIQTLPTDFLVGNGFYAHNNDVGMI